MPENRPRIPSELRRRVLIEAGHRCAIPTCKSTPVEIAHIVPWTKIKKHEFKNLIALCPTCHARYDAPGSPIDLKAMRQYKADLNPLLSGKLLSKEGQPALFAAYQEFRGRFSQWVSAEIEYVSAATRTATSTQQDADLTESPDMKFAWAIGATADFQSAWGDSEASDLVGAIFYRVANWADRIHDTQNSPFEELTADIAEEISEMSAALHLAVCSELSM